MVRKVQFFEADNTPSIEEDVNNFLDTLNDWDVIDVKYNQNYMPAGDGWYKPIWYSAMVFYTDHVYPVPKAE